MARWNEERGQWEGGREREGERGWRAREERGGWPSEDTWRGGGWREPEERAEREARRGRERGSEAMGREPGGRAEWDRLYGREPDWSQRRGRWGARGEAGYYGERGEGEGREGGGWRRSTQYEPAGEGPGSWGPEGRYGREYGGREREYGGRSEYGGSMGGMAGRYGEGERRSEARSDFGRGEYGGGGREYYGRGDWARGGDEPGPMERLGERMREGWRKMTGRGPKGYKRSDERIREDVSERIARSNIDADEVEVKVEGAEVTLTGFVVSRWDKRMLEDIHLRARREAATTGTRETAAGRTTGQSGMTGQTRSQQPGSISPDPGTSGHH
jgi:hypothetical protein